MRINGVIEAQEAFHARAAAARDGVFGRHVFVRGVVTVRDWGGWGEEAESDSQAGTHAPATGRVVADGRAAAR